MLVEPGTILEGGRIQNNDIYDLATFATQSANLVTTGATLTNVITTGNTPEPPPPTEPPVTPIGRANYADFGLAPAGNMNGALLLDGDIKTKAWSILDAGTNGVWRYSGTSMKPGGGTGRVFAMLDLNAESATDARLRYGAVKATLATLSTGPEAFIALASNIGTDGSFMYFGPRYSVSAWKYRFARRGPAGTSDIIIADVAMTPAVGDVISMSMDGANVICYVNDVEVARLPWDQYHYGRWGMLGSLSSDSVSSFKNFSYTSGE